MTTHDVVGVGLGPFNLGLAALLEPLGVDAVFCDRRPAFDWHPGLMLDGAALQVPFLADLVTLADPTSRWSFLNYLHERERLYRFYFYERFHVPRAEYAAYCRWVAESLPSCRFGCEVTEVVPDGDGWLVRAGGEALRARHVVLGVGGVPHVPVTGDGVLHASEFLGARERVLAAPRVTVVGSGQSAAEVFCDLLEAQPARGFRLDWFTRSSGFLPMEYSKLGLEHFTPEYTDSFHRLPERRRDAVRAGQDLLYKGISAETSARIYDLLYERTVDAEDPDVGYRAGCELLAAAGGVLRFRHVLEDVEFDHPSDVTVLATGYRPAPLPLADGVAALDGRGRPVVERDFRVRLADGRPSTLFVVNGELHTHGVGAPDLGLGAHRSSVIANAIAGREAYRVPRRTVFQSFGAP